MNTAIEITPEEAGNLIKNNKDGKFFTVVFVKRTNGELRVMNCRKGVKAGVSGEGHKFNPDDKNLVCVRDVQKRAFRMVSLENITQIHMKGKKYEIVPGE